MFRQLCVAAAGVLFLVAASPPADPAAAFGAREAVLDVALSPAGTKVAFIAPGPGQSTILYTSDAGGGTPPVRVMTADGKPERLSECGWASETRLVCTVYMLIDNIVPGQPVGATRINAVDADGSKLKLLSKRTNTDSLYMAFGGGEVLDWLPGEDGVVLMGRQYVPEARIGSNFQDRREGFGVDRIDTRTSSARMVEVPKAHAAAYISDGRGTVRLMAISDIAGATGYDTGKLEYFYRKKGSQDWEPLGTYDVSTEVGLLPVAVDPTLDVAYGFRRDSSGRRALYSVALDGTKRETLVFAHPEVDVDATVRIGRANRVVGVTYATDRREAVYFDPALAALGKALSKALPGLPLVRFLDSSVDETKLLLWAGGDTDPGRYYLFDKTTKKLNELMLARPDLESTQLATVKPIAYKAADGTMIPGYLTLPPGAAAKGLPAIVMPHGGPSARDEWGFDWLAQYYASRGYAVLQPNYRGSSGYGDAWYQKNGFQSWRTAIGDINDAGRWLVAQGIADPSKLAIVGWSYGGYAALQSNVLDPNLFKAVVAVAPVTDLAGLIQDSVWFSSHRITRNFIGSGPHVREGSPAENAAKIKAPVLLFHGDMDLNVGIRQSRIMQDRLKDAGANSELIVYPGLDHQLDDAAARSDLLRRSDAFLKAALKLP